MAVKTAKAVKATAKSSPKSAATKQAGTVKVKKSAPAVERPTYLDIADKLNGKLKDIKPIKIGDEKITPRRFHLPPEVIAEMRKEYAETKRMPNPQNKGLYWALIESLLNLGKDKSHQYSAVKAEIKRLMSDAETKDADGKTAWQRYINKDAHTDDAESALNVDGKLHQNAEVLQRLGGMTPYGLKLLQVGTLILKTKGVVIDILKDKDGKSRLYRLNTNSGKPQNDFRRSRA